MEPLTLHTPSLDHMQFDLLCSEVDEFEPLPAPAAAPLEFADEDDDADTGLDEQILAALVTPGY